MKDKEPKLEEIETSHTLGGAVIHLDSSVSRAFFRLWWSRVFAKTRGKEKALGPRRGPVRRKKADARKRVVHGTLGDREESEWIRNRQDQCTDS